MLDATAEAVRGGAQRQLRVDLELARDVDGREQHVAGLVEGRVAVALGRPQLLELALDRVVGDVLEVEAARGGAALDLARVQGAREVLGHLAEDARLAARLGALDRVPVAQDLARALHLGLPEHVRVAADQLLAAVLGDLGERAAAALLEQQREEVHLEEHVAELVEQLGVVTGVRGGRQLVGLLDRVRHDRALVLLAIPRALHAQAAGERVEALNRRCGVLGVAQLPSGVAVG